MFAVEREWRGAGLLSRKVLTGENLARGATGHSLGGPRTLLALHNPSHMKPHRWSVECTDESRVKLGRGHVRERI